MKKFLQSSRWLRLPALISFFLLFPAALWAENCPFCYSKAMSSGEAILRAFRQGILVLMLPPFFMSIAIFVLTYRRRNSFRSR
jgi:hypothetical protein